jgi:hypothetical protein
MLPQNTMGNEQSIQKAISLAKRKEDTSLVFRGEPLDIKLIPQEAAQLGLECLKLIDMSLVICKRFYFYFQCRQSCLACKV